MLDRFFSCCPCTADLLMESHQVGRKAIRYALRSGMRVKPYPAVKACRGNAAMEYLGISLACVKYRYLH